MFSTGIKYIKNHIEIFFAITKEKIAVYRNEESFGILQKPIDSIPIKNIKKLTINKTDLYQKHKTFEIDFIRIQKGTNEIKEKNVELCIFNNEKFEELLSVLLFLMEANNNDVNFQKDSSTYLKKYIKKEENEQKLRSKSKQKETASESLSNLQYSRSQFHTKKEKEEEDYTDIKLKSKKQEKYKLKENEENNSKSINENIITKLEEKEKEKLSENRKFTYKNMTGSFSEKSSEEQKESKILYQK